MITAVQSCGCPSKFPPASPSFPLLDECASITTGGKSFSHFCPSSTPSSCYASRPSTAVSDCRPQSSLSRSKRVRYRQPFENPRAAISKEEEAKCPCPRAGDPRQEAMMNSCSPCCAGVSYPESKVVSKIVAGGKPYKEIEAVINENRLVIRVQRESVDSEWDPACDCAEGVSRLGGGCEIGGPSRCGENVLFRKSGNSEMNGCPTGRKEDSGNCRTVTVFPQIEVSAPKEISRDEDAADKKESKKEKSDKIRAPRLEEIEDNPNIFLLRIRKRSGNPERKNNIDLEFRTPRPWIYLPKPKPKPKTPIEEPTEIPKGKKTPKGKGKTNKKKGKK